MIPESLNNILKTTFNTFFKTAFCLCIFNDNNSTKIPINSQDFQIYRYNLNNPGAPFANHRCDGIIINDCDNPRQSFEKIEDLMKFRHTEHRVQYNQRKYVFIATDRNLCLEIFNSDYLDFVNDVLNICVYCYENAKSCVDFFPKLKEAVFYVLDFFTHSYAGNLKKKKNAPVLLDRWFSGNSSFAYRKQLVVDKKGDQKGRDLNVATFTYGPYSLPHKNVGTELSLIKEFAKRRNNTLKIIVDDFELWGTTFDNFSGTGVFGRVARDEADIGFSAIFFWERNHRYIDYSQYYVRSGVTCFVPSPKTFLKLTDIFPVLTDYAALCFLISILLLGILLYLAEIMHDVSRENTKKKKDEPKNNLKRIYADILQIILLIPIVIRLKTKMKCVYVAIYFLSVIIYNVHSGILSSKLTVRSYADSINTVDELAENDVIWIGTQASAWIDSIKHDDGVTYGRLLGNFRELNDVLLTGDQAHAAERLLSGYFVIEDYITLEMLSGLEVMEEDLYWQFSTFITRKNSVLLPALNDFVLRAISAGLHLFWESQATIRSNLKKQEVLQISYQPRETKLNLEHLRGLFWIWFSGCIVALIVFAGEICLSKYYKRK